MARRGSRPMWVDDEVLNKLLKLKREKSFKENKEYSLADITNLMLKHPLINQIERDIVEQKTPLSFQFNIMMNKRRKYNG